ncbi:c-type cytochrome [Sphingomicrobium lutaoense]|uniref:Cytochrome c n=1 Tax=Sphingomicrobium lutaoense TaxID=515949 RepID=A0A839Z1N7_9SPHN|nr:cytochrome c family protein [Sphingomicrobium lutaoense]MBB3764478.1 cytochrome c [Sphingomicrobium lutaoense]
MDNRNNTIAGWALFAGIVALGATIVTGEYFSGKDAEACEDEGGYCPSYVAEATAGGGEAEEEMPVSFYLATADATRGENVFKKCTACHTIAPGGANGIGPALYGVMGNPIAGHAGFAYSDALKGIGGTWTWEEMDAWLARPARYAPGTKMSFAGLGDPQERADLLLYLNQNDGSPLAVPPPPPPVSEEEAAAEDAAAEGDAQLAEDSPELEAGVGEVAEGPDGGLNVPEKQ